VGIRQRRKRSCCRHWKEDESAKPYGKRQQHQEAKEVHAGNGTKVHAAERAKSLLAMEEP
jgi:hypothetical protein